MPCSLHAPKSHPIRRALCSLPPQIVLCPPRCASLPRSVLHAQPVARGGVLLRTVTQRRLPVASAHRGRHRALHRRLLLGDWRGVCARCACAWDRVLPRPYCPSVLEMRLVYVSTVCVCASACCAVHAAPVHAAPVHAAPCMLRRACWAVHAAPVHAAPVHAAPCMLRRACCAVHAAPVHAAPVHAAPVHVTGCRLGPFALGTSRMRVRCTACAHCACTCCLRTFPTHPARSLRVLECPCAGVVLGAGVL